jgi:hypothetical protein
LEGRVLLRRLSGPAAAHRTHGDIQCSDPAAAPGCIYRDDRRARPLHLRSGDPGARWLRWIHPDTLCQQRDSAGADGSCGAGPAAAVSAADLVWDGEQLPAHSQRNRRSESVRSEDQSSIRLRSRRSARPPVQVSGPIHPVLGSPSFGAITSAGDPRVIQLALKLWW